MGYDAPEGVEIRGRYDEEFATILSKDALQFVADLQREFKNDIKNAMECRKEAQMRYNNGELPGFDPATKLVRDGEWVCAAVPPVVADRRVEITGPVDRKMVINALNSGAKVFMVPPAELEHLLQSIPEIADAAVVPYPDEDAGQIPMAYVVIKPGSTVTATQIMDYIAKQVAPYKKIRRLAFIDSIPKSPAGKILRRELAIHAVSATSSKL